MGWQVNFYGTQKDMNELCEFIKKKGGIVIQEDGKELTEEDLQHITDFEYIKKRFRYWNFYIKRKDSKIVYNYYSENNRKCVSDSYSDVLSFSIPWIRNNQKEYDRGRVYYYGQCEGWGANTEETKKLYNAIKRYIKNNYVKRKEEFGFQVYMGKDGYEQLKNGTLSPELFKFCTYC